MEDEAEILALFFKSIWSFPGRVPLMREASCSDSPIQGKPPQAGNVVRKKSSSALEHNQDIILRGSYLHLVNRLY